MVLKKKKIKKRPKKVKKKYYKPSKPQLPKDKRFMGQDAFPRAYNDGGGVTQFYETFDTDYYTMEPYKNKFLQYRSGMDNFWPQRITDIPYYENILYTAPAHNSFINTFQQYNEQNPYDGYNDMSRDDGVLNQREYSEEESDEEEEEEEIIIKKSKNTDNINIAIMILLIIVILLNY